MFLEDSNFVDACKRANELLHSSDAIFVQNAYEFFIVSSIEGLTHLQRNTQIHSVVLQLPSFCCDTKW